jgi:hypothetical protein
MTDINPIEASAEVNSATALLNDMYIRFAAVLNEVGHLVKDATADTGKYVMKYADINQILSMLKPILASHKLALSQPIEHVDGCMMVTTLLIHTENGRQLRFPGPLCPTKADPQALGSAITYFRRYGLVSLFALEAEDDDGGKAHRAEVVPQNRTVAEDKIRAIIKTLDKNELMLFRPAFTAEFNSTLTAMPESSHGDALTWVMSGLWRTFVPDTAEIVDVAEEIPSHYNTHE